MNLMLVKIKTRISKPKFTTGFTLVELLVTISIFVILTGVVLFNQQKFNSTILLTNLAYDTALTIRQAQNYGINIREFDSGTGGVFVPYGVHFNKTAPKSFILFADTNFLISSPSLLNVYNGATSTCSNSGGCVNRYSIKRGNYIFDLKVTDDGGRETSVSKLNIIFKRPDPDAIIYGANGGVKYAKASIILKGVDGESIRTVNVQKNGLIEIK